MKIGIIGAGMIGSTVAKLWADAGHDVIVASRHPEDLQPPFNGSVFGRRRGRARSRRLGNVVMLTVPLRRSPISPAI
jgi:predicted dinucleotide-binding enzyme